MSNYSKTAKEDIEKTNYENLEIFKRAISEAMTAKNQKLDEEIKDITGPLPFFARIEQPAPVTVHCDVGGLWLPSSKGYLNCLSAVEK